MPKRRGYRVKRRTHKEIDENNDDPKSFVVKRGPVGKSLGALVSNMREVMLPYSAKKLRESKATKLKDLISLSSHFHVTHVQMFTQKDSGVYYRVAGIPNGPTVTFQVKEFSLMSDVRSNQKRPRSVLSDFQLSPLVVLSGFRKNLDDSQNPQLGAGVTITAKVLTNMYPAVDVEKMNVSVCRRVVLYNRNPQTGLIEFRHYAVVSRSAGVSRAVRKLLSVNPNKIPKLGNKRDISEYIENAGAASDSEFEDTQEVSAVKRNKSSGHHTEQLALSLVELGPRMTLELVTVEEGFWVVMLFTQDLLNQRVHNHNVRM